MSRQEELQAQFAARAFFADRLEAHFRAHPHTWISILELMRIGGPSWRSRIVGDLREKRGMDVPWNGNNRQSAYMFRPESLGREADSFVPGNAETGTLFPLQHQLSEWQE